MQTIRTLKAQFPRPGRVEWIGIRPGRRQPPVVVDTVDAIAGQGLDGDHYASANGSRQVTLIQHEHLAAIASLIGSRQVDPALLRRNVVVSGLNLFALKGQVFDIGSARLRHTGPCEPCSLMQSALGAGGYNAMRGHGGITAEILVGGSIAIGDTVRVPATGVESEKGEKHG